MNPASTDGFAAALLDSDAKVPTVCTTWNGSDVAQRFGIYRNNVVASLIDALRAKFPVVEALVGDEFFAGMARHYVVGHPPQSRIMTCYGDSFPAFVAAFEPARSLPYLADVARLEVARVTAHHAADVPVLSPTDLSAIAGERLADIVATLHPSAQILRSEHAIFSLWAAHQGACDIATVDPMIAEDALVLRPADDVLVLLLPPGAASTLDALAQGRSIGDALVTAGAMTDIDVQAIFHLIITSGVLSAARLT